MKIFLLGEHMHQAFLWMLLMEMGRKDTNQVILITIRKALDLSNETPTRGIGREEMGCAKLGGKASAGEGGLIFNSYYWRWSGERTGSLPCVVTSNHHPDTVYSKEEPRVSDALL